MLRDLIFGNEYEQREAEIERGFRKIARSRPCWMREKMYAGSVGMDDDWKIWLRGFWRRLKRFMRD